MHKNNWNGQLKKVRAESVPPVYKIKKAFAALSSFKILTLILFLATNLLPIEINWKSKQNLPKKFLEYQNYPNKNVGITICLDNVYLIYPCFFFQNLSNFPQIFTFWPKIPENSRNCHLKFRNFWNWCQTFLKIVCKQNGLTGNINLLSRYSLKSNVLL